MLVARRAQRLASTADGLHQYGVRVETIPFDLSRPAAGSELREAVADRGVAVTSLINNAAFGTFGPFAESDPGRLAGEIAVDAAAPVQLTAAFMPQMLSAACGFIINVAGVSAYFPSPRMAVYSAAKAFLLSFTESLWMELRGTGLTVFALCPGATDTDFTFGMGTGASVLRSARMRTPEHAVATALRHLERRNPGPSVIDGRSNQLGVIVSRLASRRTSAMMMDRVLDPNRGSKAAAS